MAAAPVELSPGRLSDRRHLRLLPPSNPTDIEEWLDAPPDVPYNPDTIADRYRGQYWKIARRIVSVVLPFLWLWIQSRCDRLLGREPERRSHYAIRLREILTELGPAYIKIGQALSTRPDLVSPVFLEELTKLQDQLPPFSNAVAYQLIEEQLGAKPDEIFQRLSSNPIAAASLGQVYKAYLRSNGAAVAIKVQRPDLVDRISIDLYIVRILARWARDNIARIKSDLVAIVDEFASKLYEEMDYQKEGRNAEKFRRLYSHPSIYVPKIHWVYTRRKVMTMEWIDGIKLTELDKIAKQGLDSRQLIETGVNCSLRQLLENGFFHADPHPGNLLAMADGRLAYLDFGMMSNVQPHQRYGLINAIVHLVNRDFEGLAHDYVELGFLTPDTDLSPIIPALSEVFASAMGASVSELNFKSITDQLSSVMYEYPFRVPAYYALIIRSLLTLEGIAIGIDPDFKVLNVAYPYIANRLLADDAPALRESLQNILFSDGEFRWNRLENLLRNASSSEDYDFEDAATRALDFLFSERGEFIRDQITEVVFSAHNNGSHSLERLQRLWDILQQDESFEPLKFLPVVGRAALRPEARELGGQLVSRWVQRSAARTIRAWLLPDAEPVRSTWRPASTASGSRAHR
ncbi:AarF/ABC1/UbiB kinase family protein [Synechococcus sp. PCC 7336]|uniref:ABC1 kinase family protein n=1 Tax=Synechococcus sp. PCC 7336 TaxID=195250 RepID=UPI0003474DE7|nr:AarF/ABC1/UbiB kinase family protein [Synechococcus sp. PCC 7336]